MRYFNAFSRRNRLWVKEILIVVLLFVLAFAVNGEDLSRERKTIGLALSGGGALGLAHIGVLKVLEEEGIEVDYIAGTSMGSVVGALYAIGYDASSLAHAAAEMKWPELLDDVIERKNLSIDDKEFEGRYLFTFPISNGKITLPTGLSDGQEISAALCRYTSHVHHIRDFSQFPIPFSCVATDIETGEAVSLNSGFLPDALRASISFPMFFPPIEIEGRLLIDGGYVRNLPAVDVKNMGADVVIGSYVGTKLYEREKLDSLDRIIVQVSVLSFLSSFEEQKSLCDVLIEPDTEGSNIASFNDTEELIEKGEQAARKMLPQLRALLKSENHSPEKQVTTGSAHRSHGKDKRMGNQKLAEYPWYITKVRISGLERVSESLVDVKLQIRPPAELTPSDLEAAVNRVYGSGLFEQVTFELLPDSTGNTLLVHTKEKGKNVLNASLHYNSDQQLKTLFNATFLNLAGQGSRILVDLELGRDSELRGIYEIYTHRMPRFGLCFNLRYEKDDVNTIVNGETDSSFLFSRLTADLAAHIIPSNSSAIGVGAQKKFSSTKRKKGPGAPDTENDECLNFYGYFEMDTLDRTYYPRKGAKIYAEAKTITGLLPIGNDADRDVAGKLSFSAHGTLQLHRRISLSGEYFLGLTQGEDIPSEYLYYFGGFSDPDEKVFPFVGFNFRGLSGTNAQIFGTAVQYEPFSNVFLTLRGNTGLAAEETTDLFGIRDWISGIGISFGVLSPLGPAELLLMRESLEKRVLLHARVGLAF
jgi:NTE family protein